VVAASLIAVAVGYLIVTAVRNTSEYYLTVGEVEARQNELRGQALRVAGRVRPGSVSWEPATLTLKFAMMEIPDAADPDGKPAAAKNGVAPVYVICRGEPKPDMFAENRDVIVEGRLGRDRKIAATQVLTSCASKYRPKSGK
jgi:cytochrome c-type biogenesis protein CcmE